MRKKKDIKTDWGYWIWFCQKNQISFLAQTMRSIQALYRCALREQGIEIDESGESDL